MKHKKPLIALSSIAISLLAGSAFAGPDWAAIERGRAAKQTEQGEQARRTAVVPCSQQKVAGQEQSQNLQNPRQP